jgi:mannose-6-phosphate isomerase
VSAPVPPDDDPRHRIVEDRRPWGQFRRYTHGETTTVKLITVEAGQELSLQRHDHRDELWVVIDAGLLVRIGDEVTEAAAGQEFFVPRGTIHRASGGAASSRFLEVAFGTFDEADIERIEDAYGRT